MHILIIYAHPNESSFNHAMLESIKQGLEQQNHKVRVKDLYAENFDPVLRASDLSALQTGEVPEHILKEQETLTWADGLVFIYPLWWFGRPAILKGWFDLVLTNGFAFQYDDEGLTGLLHHKKALVLITAGGSEEYFRKNNAEPLVHRPMTDGTLAFCGIQDVEHKIYYNIPSMTDQERKAILKEVKSLALRFDDTQT